MKVRLRSLLLFAGLANLVVLAVPGSSTPPDAHAGAVKLLNESYYNSAKLDSTERIYYLATLVQLAAHTGHENTKTWALELYARANDIKSDWDRVAAQKNALIALVRVDAHRAVELLRSLNPPDVKHAPEDLRADAAVAIFPYYRSLGPSGLSEIEDVAVWIGDSGEYPYHAMATIVQNLSRAQDERAKQEVTKIFTAAFASFQKPSKYKNANAEFLRMLESGEFAASRSIYSQALHAYVQKLESEADQPDPNFQANVYTAKGVFHFSNSSKMLLFRVWPLADRLDPAWGRELRAHHAELSQAGDDIEHIQQGIIEGPAGQDEAAQMQKQLNEEGRLAQIDRLQQFNPWGAFDLAQKEVKNPEARIVAFSSILPTISQLDPLQARNMYAQQLQAADEIGDVSSNLAATIALAKSAYYMGDEHAFSKYAVQALESGARRFQQDKEQDKKGTKHVFERPGYAELTSFVEFCTEHGAAWIVGNVREFQDDSLKTYLLAYAGQGQYNQPSSILEAASGDSEMPQKSTETATALERVPKK